MAFAAASPEHAIVTQGSPHTPPAPVGAATRQRLAARKYFTAPIALFFKRPVALDLGKEKQLVQEIRAARYGYEPHVHFIDDYDREDISRLGLVGLSRAGEQLDFLEEYLAKSKAHARVLEMVGNWRRRHFTPVYNLHVKVRNRLPEWKSTVLEASEPHRVEAVDPGPGQHPLGDLDDLLGGPSWPASANPSIRRWVCSNSKSSVTPCQWESLSGKASACPDLAIGTLDTPGRF